jgi:hypothetical protein
MCKTTPSPRFLQRGDPETATPKKERLLLPGAFLMAMSAQLLAALMFIDLCFPTFL